MVTANGEMVRHITMTGTIVKIQYIHQKTVGSDAKSVESRKNQTRTPKVRQMIERERDEKRNKTETLKITVMMGQM